MEIIAFMLMLVAVFAVKAAFIMRWHDDEVAKSASFSWTKPGVEVGATAEPAVARQAESGRTGVWTPSGTVARLRGNRWAMPAAR